MIALPLPSKGAKRPPAALGRCCFGVVEVIRMKKNSTSIGLTGTKRSFVGLLRGIGRLGLLVEFTGTKA